MMPTRPDDVPIPLGPRPGARLVKDALDLLTTAAEEHADWLGLATSVGDELQDLLASSTDALLRDSSLVGALVAGLTTQRAYLVAVLEVVDRARTERPGHDWCT
jgi:hypothetical protein